MKRFIISLLILAILLTCTSCQSTNTSKKSNSDLSIYLIEFDLSTKQSVDKFNSARENHKISIKTFFADQTQDYQNTLLSELSNGTGPDIIVLYSSYMTNLAKFLSLDAFYDINELIGQDKTFKIEDYDNRILNCGVKDGKRYFIPLSYTLDALFSTDEILKEHNLNIDNHVLSLEDMITLSKNFTNQNGSTFINSLPYIGYMNGFVDPMKQTASFNTEEFRNFMKQYRTLHQSATVVAGNPLDLSLLAQDKTALFNMSIYGINSTVAPYQMYDKAVKDPVILSYTMSDEKSGIPATPTVMVAINKNCADKESAFQFIKLLLSTEEQVEIGKIDAIPVNLKAYEKIKDDMINLISNNSGGIKDEAALSGIITQTDALVKGNLFCMVHDAEVNNIIQEELTKYVAGSKTEDAACKDIQDRVNSYFKNSSSNEELPTASAAPQNITELTLHYMEYNYFVKNAIRVFNDNHKDVRIKGTMYSKKEYENYKTMLTTSVMAGEGPDILVYTTDIFNSLTKTMATGAFADLNPLMQKDSTFDTSVFYPEVFDAGVMGDKRYFIPLFFDVPTLIASKSSLASIGLTIGDSGWTLNDLKNAIANLKALDSSGTQYFFDSYMNFISLVRSSGLQLVDYQNKTTDFQSKEFIELLMLYKEIAPLVPSVETEYSLGLTPALLRDKIIRMASFGPQMPIFLARTNAIVAHYLQNDYVILPFPTVESGAKYPATLYDVVSINAKCENQETAFEFVKLLLSDEAQRTYNSYKFHNDISGLPVNKSAYFKDIEDLKDPKNNEGLTAISNGVETVGIKNVALTDELVDMAININNRMAAPNYLDKEVENIINEGLQAYLSGKRTAEQAAKEIDEKVSLFLNE